MQKICHRGLHAFYVMNAMGDCRLCGWMTNQNIGNLLENSVEEIYHGAVAEGIHNRFFEGDYSNCIKDMCPYLANGTLDEHMEEIECMPKYPEELWLAYEGVCNYQCTCCSAHSNMEMGKQGNWEKNYDIIEERLKPMLPYVKKIAAHGRGELFASKRILKLLSEWEPMCPEDEAEVVLETNGSLFNEKNWSQIANLGKYNLKVAITVMSFQEKTYQYLSGTKLPISNLEHNLEFVKSLREQGIINELELATVLQERNFREMPEFVERCLSYGADVVRLRPMFLCGASNRNIEWFADVRTPSHPYHEEFLEVMQNPIFNHPKVFLWSGRRDSDAGIHPGIKTERALQYITKMLQEQDLAAKISGCLENCGGVAKLSVYGMGGVGKLIVKLCGDRLCIDQLVDRYCYDYQYEGHEVIAPEKMQKDADGVLLLTLVDKVDEVTQYLRNIGYQGRIVTLQEIFGECC